MPLFQLWNFPAIPARRVFPWKKKRHPAGAGSIACEFTLTCEPKTHCTWKIKVKVNPRNVAGFLRRAFSLKKRNVGAVGCESYKFTVTLDARRVALKKTHGIWKGFRDARFSWKRYGIRERLVACHMNVQSQWTQDAFYLGKHKESRGLVQHALFIEKHKQRWVIRGIQIYSQDEGQAHCTWQNTTISPASAWLTWKFTVKIKPRRSLHEKTERFLRGRWRREEGVYINKEQRWE